MAACTVQNCESSKKIIAGGNHAKTARYEGCVIERNWSGAVVGTIFSRGEGSAVHGPSLCKYHYCISVLRKAMLIVIIDCLFLCSITITILSKVELTRARRVLRALCLASI